jgi:hypothetical protein
MKWIKKNENKEPKRAEHIVSAEEEKKK